MNKFTETFILTNFEKIDFFFSILYTVSRSLRQTVLKAGINPNLSEVLRSLKKG